MKYCRFYIINNIRIESFVNLLDFYCIAGLRDPENINNSKLPKIDLLVFEEKWELCAMKPVKRNE